VIAIGEDLIRAKEILGHGGFGPWLEEEFSLSHRAATGFMRAATRFGGRLEAASNLPGGVLVELASSNIPDEVVDQVLAGELAPSVTAVRQATRTNRRHAASWRAARRFVDELWTLPDRTDIAAWVLSNAIRREDADFIDWAAAVFRRAAARLDPDGS
jgi:hypothetical protein